MGLKAIQPARKWFMVAAIKETHLLVGNKPHALQGRGIQGGLICNMSFFHFGAGEHPECKWSGGGEMTGIV